MIGILVVVLLVAGAWTQLQPWLSGKGLSAAELEQWRQDDHVVVADPRSAEEFAAGHIAGSLSRPCQRAADIIGTLPAERPVVLVCRTGCRSLEIARVLQHRHRERVYWLRGGMVAWATERVRVLEGRDAGAAV
jgi:rhodanese-related sulfurtransferase